MCYNAAHPNTWGNIFSIRNEDDIEKIINETYINQYSGIPGGNGWYTDQEIMYKKLINYPNLKVLNRPLKRLEMYDFNYKKSIGLNNFISNYDDSHFHRSYFNNIDNITHAEKQL
jgi:hypothetical protein